VSIQRLTPCVPVERFYPRNAAFMTRTDLQTTRLLAFTTLNLDSITNIFLGLMNGVATVRHGAGVTDDILMLFERAGLPVEEEMHVYESGNEAEAKADALIAQGRKLFFVYPPSPGRFADKDYLVSPSLWARLNSKGHLAELATPQHLAPRRIGRFAELGAFDKPVYLKDASLGASGGGRTVRACPTPEAWAKAIEEFTTLGIETVVIEDALKVESCWCVCLVIDSETTTYAGAAEQVFESPGVQVSSIIDPDNLLPEEGVRLAIEAGERARSLGYVGVAGLDIGRTSDGRFILFDPNFRVNSSSRQTLLHASAAQRAGLPVSYATFSLSPLPFAEIKRRLLGPIDDGWFVPARFIDAARHPDAERSACGGIVLGANRQEAIAAAAKIDAMLAG
jgi:hypothetical protein